MACGGEGLRHKHASREGGRGGEREKEARAHRELSKVAIEEKGLAVRPASRLEGCADPRELDQFKSLLLARPR